MKTEYLVVALVCACVLFSGCCALDYFRFGPPTITTPTPEVSPTGTPEGGETPQEMAPFTASEGVTAAAAGITWLRRDAQLVGIQGSCGGDGKAPQWDYNFDSVAAGRGYVVSVPGGAATMRETTFSFNRGLGTSWIDSSQAASVCGLGESECSLEMSEGTPVWTLVSGSSICMVNATSGQRMEGD